MLNYSASVKSKYIGQCCLCHFHLLKSGKYLPEHRGEAFETTAKFQMIIIIIYRFKTQSTIHSRDIYTFDALRFGRAKQSDFIFIWAKAESYDIFENLGAECKQRQRCLNHGVVYGSGKQTSSTEPFPDGYPSDGRISGNGAWASPRRGGAVFPGQEAVSSPTVHFPVFQRGSAESKHRWMGSSSAEHDSCGQRLGKNSNMFNCQSHTYLHSKCKKCYKYQILTYSISIFSNMFARDSHSLCSTGKFNIFIRSNKVQTGRSLLLYLTIASY